MSRPARVSPDRILAAAAAEFAARGFGGARVDRIARRARVNKAMIYYHFRSKEALYRALLRDVFARAAERLRACAREPGPAAEKMDRLIAALTGFVAEHTFFPAIMLREIAEGGMHLDRETLQALAALPAVVAAVVEEGVAEGAFRPVHPLFAYLTLVAPIVTFLAGAPIQHRVAALRLQSLTAITPGEFVGYMQASVRRSLSADSAPARHRS